MNRKKNIIGWTGVVLTVIISGLWAYWGAIENFHEGWYSTSIWENLFMLFAQYLLITFIFMLLGLFALKFKKSGLALHIALGIFCAFFFSGANFTVVGILIVIPIVLLGLLYYFGEPQPKKWAYRSIILIPLTVILVISVPQFISVSQRVNDHDFGMRTVEGNGVTLTWAPRGPGWPDKGVSWQDANDICVYLSEDGTTLMDTPQNIWRLPTADEAVRCMTCRNENVGGILNADTMKAEYKTTPDKETPLWDPNSKVIYYWTSDSALDSPERAYIIVYHGGVYTKMKTDAQAYLSFRAVKEIK